MTTAGKTGTALAGVMAVLALVMSPQALPVIQFLFGELKVFASLPLFAPVAIAVFVGALASAWLPHMLPSKWEAHKTKRVTRLLASGIAFVMVATQYPSAIGFQYAAFAATGAYVLWTMVSSFIYRTLPQSKPASMDESGES